MAKNRVREGVEEEVLCTWKSSWLSLQCLSKATPNTKYTDSRLIAANYLIMPSTTEIFWKLYPNVCKFTCLSVTCKLHYNPLISQCKSYY